MKSESIKSIENIFPAIKDAHAYLKHGNFPSALQVYVNILNDVEEGTEEYSHILLEYAQCLIENVMYQSEMNYKKILQTRNPQDEGEIEEDLENCWVCLETCRLHFTDLKNGEKLAEVYKGLGDVLCLKNCFEEGISEYLNAMSQCDNDELTVEILECIAECYRNMKLYDESIGYYERTIELFEKLGRPKEAEECRNLVEGIKGLMEEKANDDDYESTLDSEAEPVNINHLRKKFY